MADEDSILDDALSDFEDHEESKAPPQIDAPADVKEAFDEIFKEMGSEENIDELGNMLKGLSDQLENNPEVKNEIDGLTNELFSHDVMLESMTELRDKLSVYLEQNRATLPQADLERYTKQYEVYQEIWKKLPEGKQEEVIELMSNTLAQYGELPKELLPPMPEECALM